MKYPKDFYFEVKQPTFKKNMKDHVTIPYDLVGDRYDSYTELERKGIVEIIGIGHIYSNNRGEVQEHEEEKLSRVFFNYVK